MHSLKAPVFYLSISIFGDFLHLSVVIGLFVDLDFTLSTENVTVVWWNVLSKIFTFSRAHKNKTILFWFDQQIHETQIETKQEALAATMF